MLGIDWPRLNTVLLLDNGLDRRALERLPDFLLHLSYGLEPESEFERSTTLWKSSLAWKISLFNSAPFAKCEKISTLSNDAIGGLSIEKVVGRLQKLVELLCRE